MKFKVTFLTVLIAVSLLLASCASSGNNKQTTAESGTDSKTESLSEVATEGMTETSTEASDPFELIRESGEEWIAHGLAAYESGKEVQDLKGFFANSSNLTYLTLYDHFFTYDPKNSVPVAEALFSFIIDKHGAEAILDIDKRIEYKNEYLISLGLEPSYNQSPEVERLLSSMELSSNDQYKYIISFDKITYYFKDFNVGSPTQYHGLLYFSTTGLHSMIDHLKENNLTEGLAINRRFNFYMTFDGSGYSKTIYSNGNMYIGDFSSTLHEAVHALGIGGQSNSNIWLSEGICEYLGKVLGFNEQIAASNIQIMKAAEKGYYDEYANAGDKSAIICKRVYEGYIGHGGKLDSVNSFDLPLYTNLYAKAELETSFYNTLGNTYKLINGKDYIGAGAELSYNQAASLVIYLSDTYGTENVLKACRTQNIESVFGKNYEDLKAEWLEHLNSQY